MIEHPHFEVIEKSYSEGLSKSTEYKPTVKFRSGESCGHPKCGSDYPCPGCGRVHCEGAVLNEWQ